MRLIVSDDPPSPRVVRGLARLRRDGRRELLGAVPGDSKLAQARADLVARSDPEDLDPGLHRITILDEETVDWSLGILSTQNAVIGRYELGRNGVFQLMSTVESLGEPRLRYVRVFGEQNGIKTVSSEPVLDIHQDDRRYGLDVLRAWFSSHCYNRVGRVYEGADPGMQMLSLKTVCGRVMVEPEWELDVPRRLLLDTHDLLRPPPGGGLVKR
jgi:hypothetical protein